MQILGRTLSKEEQEVLKKIKTAIPKELLKRSKILTAKNRSETITPVEHQELIQVIDEIETKNVERVKYMIELSKLTHIPLPELAKQFKPKSSF